MIQFFLHWGILHDAGRLFRNFHVSYNLNQWDLLKCSGLLNEPPHDIGLEFICPLLWPLRPLKGQMCMCWSHLVSSIMIPNILSISLSIGIGHRSQYQNRNRNFSFLGLSIIPGLEKLLPLVSVSASVSEKLVSPTSDWNLCQSCLTDNQAVSCLAYKLRPGLLLCGKCFKNRIIPFYP